MSLICCVRQTCTRACDSSNLKTQKKLAIVLPPAGSLISRGMWVGKCRNLTNRPSYPYSRITELPCTPLDDYSYHDGSLIHRTKMPPRARSSYCHWHEHRLAQPACCLLYSRSSPINAMICADVGKLNPLIHSRSMSSNLGDSRNQN